MNPESAWEMITWHYNYGGDPFDGELVVYAASARNANPAAIWIVIN